MKIGYLAAIAIVAACAGLAVHSVSSLPPEKQSTPPPPNWRPYSNCVDTFLHRRG